MSKVIQKNETCNKELENEYFHQANRYQSVLRPYGLGHIPEKESQKATAIWQKVEAIANQLGYYPTKTKPMETQKILDRIPTMMLE